jgi:hypothetical protein
VACSGCGPSWHASVDRILVCPGIHSVLTALFSQLARPGELICVESLTYPGVKAIAAQLGVQLHALQLDDDGPDADAFEHACKTLKPKALYCNPTLLNPTGGHRVARAARSAGRRGAALRVPIIEDDAYGMLPRQAPAARHAGAGAHLLRERFLEVFRRGAAQRLCVFTDGGAVAAAGRRDARDHGDGLADHQRADHAVGGRRHHRGHAAGGARESVARQLLAMRTWATAACRRTPRASMHGCRSRRAGARWSSPPTCARRTWAWWPARRFRAPTAIRPTRCASAWAGRCRASSATQALRLIADTLAHPLHPHATLRAGAGQVAGVSVRKVAKSFRRGFRRVFDIGGRTGQKGRCKALGRGRNEIYC